MMGLLKYRLILLLSGVILLASCQKVVVTVNDIPDNTPSNQSLYIAGNFNNWDPGDERYQLIMNPDSSWSIELPPGFGTIEYKITRGDWTTVERDICGYEIDNHKAVIGESDTVFNQVESWNDLDPLNCPRLTLLVNQIPENTPEDHVIAIAGNFNRWAVDSSSQLIKDSAGNYTITIDRPPDVEEVEIKFTRGDLESAEADEFGNMIPNRVLKFGVQDTVEVKVEGWIDRESTISRRVVIILDGVPPNTPDQNQICLASSMNGWNPGDKNYYFQKNKNGQLFFPVPRKKYPLDFKITRGSWGSVEVDRYGYDIDNRVLDMANTDTLYITVEGWKDQASINDFDVTIIIDQMPSSTPVNDDIYITGNFNSWRPGRLKNRFKTLPSGEYAISLPRGRGELVFKVTRGSWDNAEVDQYGNDFPNRTYFFQNIDTVFIDVENWKDLPRYSLDRVTLVIDKIPENTPKSDNFFLSADQFDWNPGNPELVFYYLRDGRPYLTIPVSGKELVYKITRGDWQTVEVDEHGFNMADRSLHYGFSDTVFIEIIGWRDFTGTY